MSVVVDYRDEVTAFLRDWMQKLAATGVKDAAMARMLDVGKPTLSLVKDGTKRAGPKIERGLAKLLFGGKIEALRAVAHRDFADAARRHVAAKAKLKRVATAEARP